MARSRPSVSLVIVVLLAIAAAVWAVSVRTRPTFAVYDTVPAPSPVAPAESAAPARAAPERVDTGPAPGGAAQSVQRPGTSPRVGLRADTAAAPAAAPASPRTDSSARSDTLRHHRSENYGGYSGYGSRERRGSPNAR